MRLLRAWPLLLQARTIIPTIPFIQEASLSGARRGVFLGLLAPGVATGVLQASPLLLCFYTSLVVLQGVSGAVATSGSLAE